MTSPAGDLLAEGRTSASWLLRAMRRRLPEIVLGTGVLLTLLGLLAVAGSVMDDLQITGHRGTTAATVLEDSSRWHAVVRFVDDEGQLHTPAVLYPSGLSEGMDIYVEYDTTNPELVRVAGRNATAGVLPIGIGLVVVWAVVGTAVVRLRRRRARAATS